MTNIQSVADARATQEVHKPDYSSIVREAILEVLRRQETFHADDLRDLGIPEQHCNVIGSQVARLVNEGWMVEDGRRKSTIPSRNGAKSNVYLLTKLGIVGLGTDVQSQREEAGGVVSAPSRVSAEPGDGSPAVVPSAGEPARLFQPEPERPLSLVTDAEAA